MKIMMMEKRKTMIFISIIRILYDDDNKDNDENR